MSYNNPDFNAGLEKFLRMIAQKINEDSTRQFPAVNRNNRFAPFIQDFEPQQQSIPLQDFIKQLHIILGDEFVGEITQENNNSLLIDFGKDTFRLQITRYNNFGGFNFNL